MLINFYSAIPAIIAILIYHTSTWSMEQGMIAERGIRYNAPQTYDFTPAAQL